MLAPRARRDLVSSRLLCEMAAARAVSPAGAVASMLGLLERSMWTISVLPDLTALVRAGMAHMGLASTSAPASIRSRARVVSRFETAAYKARPFSVLALASLSFSSSSVLGPTLRREFVFPCGNCERDAEWASLGVGLRFCWLWTWLLIHPDESILLGFGSSIEYVGGGSGLSIVVYSNCRMIEKWCWEEIQFNSIIIYSCVLLVQHLLVHLPRS